MDDEKQPDGQPEEKFGREQAQEMINSAMASVTRQFGAKIEKSFNDFAAKLAEKKPDPEPAAPADKDKDKDSKSKVYEQQLADLKRRLDESETKARQVEEVARQERTQVQLRAQLEAAGVRPELLDVAVGHLAKVTGALRYGEDGAPMLAIKRSRAKGAAAEEYLHPDLKSGVADWKQSEEAKPFLAPPSSAKPAGSGFSPPFNPNGQSNRRSPLDEIFSQVASAAASAHGETE